jgi:hypothetical protein
MLTNESGPPVPAERAAKSNTSAAKYTCPDGLGEVECVPPLIPPGTYRLRFSHWWTGILFGKAHKLAVSFKVMDFGEHFDAELRRWYNVQIPQGRRTGRNGVFKAGWGSDLMREYASLIGMVKRNDRIALTHYANKVILGEVVTVKTAHDQEELPEALQYSVVRRLLSVEAGQRST